jgi:uncharacterized membrane protein
MGKTYLRQFVRSRPHLLLAILLGIAIGLAWPGQRHWLQRALIGWNGGVWPYLLSMTWMMLRADPGKVRAIASRQDESAGLVLGTLLVGAILSFSAIVSELARLDHPSASMLAERYAFTALTVIGSWLLVGVLFTFHYAHLYYRAPQDKPPLRFPEEGLAPDYGDFLYFAFTIAVAVQTADVSVVARGMRRLVLAHSLLAFFFNLAVLGLSINIAASVVNS